MNKKNGKSVKFFTVIVIAAALAGTGCYIIRNPWIFEPSDRSVFERIFLPVEREFIVKTDFSESEKDALWEELNLKFDRSARVYAMQELSTFKETFYWVIIEGISAEEYAENISSRVFYEDAEIDIVDDSSIKFPDGSTSAESYALVGGFNFFKINGRYYAMTMIQSKSSPELDEIVNKNQNRALYKYTKE